MCRVGGPRCDSKWGRARRDLDNAVRARDRAGSDEAVANADHKIDVARTRLTYEVSASSTHIVESAAAVVGVDPDPDLNSLNRTTFQSGDISKEAMKDIGKDEYEAIGSYSGSEFRKLNAVRRGKTAGLSFTEEDVIEIAQMDDVMKKSMRLRGVELPCAAYRGIVPDGVSRMSADSAIRSMERAFPVGARVVDRGWMSTSSDFFVASRIARTHTKDEQQAHCVFRVFGGRSLPISAISAHPEEEEFIVEPGTPYTVVGTHDIDDGFGRRYLLVDIVSDGFAGEHLDGIADDVVKD